MKVFVAGATGVLGKQLVPLLVANGHDVVGMTRTDAKRDRLRSVGAQPVVADALDANAVGRAVGEAEPEVIVHQLTAIPPALNMRHFDREFAPTNRLRTEGTDHLLSAGRAVGVKRVVVESFAGVSYARTGARSSGRTLRSMTILRRRCVRCSRRSVTSRRRSRAHAGPRASCCATAGCTDPAPRLPSTHPAARSS
jgi:nucleoside-diphosphate-sugar epimerase